MTIEVSCGKCGHGMLVVLSHRVVSGSAPELGPENFDDADAVGRLWRLGQREREIAAGVAEGLTNREIAARLLISEQTVKNHLHNMFVKLRISDRLTLALAMIARERSSSPGLAPGVEIETGVKAPRESRLMTVSEALREWK